MKRTVTAFAAIMLAVWLLATPALARDRDRSHGCNDNSCYYYYDEYDFPALGIGCCGGDRHGRDDGKHRPSRRDRSHDVDDGNYWHEARRDRDESRDEDDQDDDDDGED